MSYYTEGAHLPRYWDELDTIYAGTLVAIEPGWATIEPTAVGKGTPERRVPSNDFPGSDSSFGPGTVAG